jgi:hypothetical protein
MTDNLKDKADYKEKYNWKVSQVLFLKYVKGLVETQFFLLLLWGWRESEKVIYKMRELSQVKLWIRIFFLKEKRWGHSRIRG